MRQAEAALRANETVDLIYGHNDPMAMGAYLAATAMNRAAGLKIIGIGGLPGAEGGRKPSRTASSTRRFFTRIAVERPSRRR